MKTMKLLPLKIAVTSALIVGLGAASTANAQQRSNPLPIEEFLPNLGELQLAGAINSDQYDQISAQYHNMIIGKTSIVSEVDANHIAQQTDSNTALKFYSDSENSLPSSMLFHQILTRQQLNGFKVGQPFIPVDNNGNPITQEDEVLDGRQKKKVRSVTTRIATQKDVEESPYANGIQKDIDDLYDFDHQVTERLTQHGKTIYRNGERILANEESVQYLNKEVQNNIEHIYELAQQQDQHSSDIKTLESNVEKGLLELSGHLIDQKADIDNNINHIYELAQQQDQHSSDIKTLKKNVEEGLLELSGHLIDQKSDIAQNQTDIQDLAAYNELQDQYAQKQTEAIDALNKASSENTQNIAKNSNHIKTLESNVEEELLNLSGRLLDQKADIDNNINHIYELAQQQDQHSSDIKTLKNNVEEGLLDLSGRLIDQKADIAKNQADIQLHDKKITNLGILHSMVARAVGNNTQGVATNKADIAKNQADIANNIKNIYELAQQQDQHSSDIKTLAKVSAANTDRIAKNKAEADASFETLTKNQNTLIEQGEALVEQNKAINQELEGFAAHADVQDKQILQNQADITANKTAIEQNINRTVANGFEIEKNKAGIATNKQELILQNDRLNRINETNNHQDQKIDQLGYALKEQGQHFNNRISAVERQTAGGIANAIAIATLPSPSRAGEHHVLFGSGYHNGQAAVSLGAAGLSDTGKSTYKIGLSWSDAGGLSGGVGGSYRWK